MLLWRRNLIYIYYDLTTITDSSREAYFAKNIDDLLVVVGPTIKSVHFIFHSIIVVFYVQHLISTYWCPVCSCLPRRPYIYLDIYN